MKRDYSHSEELFQTHIGGAAMLEGVMMRGRYSWAVAVREPEGSIYIEEHDVPGYGKKQPWRKWPLIRGCVSLIESLVLQYKAMGITSAHAYNFDDEASDGAAKDSCDGATEGASVEALANAQTALKEPESAESHAHAVEEESEARKSQAQIASEEAEQSGMAPWMIVSMVIGVVLGVALFVLVPAGLTNLTVGDYTRENMVVWNLVEGALRAAVFVLYIWLIGFMPDIKRMFGYHGAEHKTIHCLEHGLALTPENCRSFSRQHVRCGTAFIIMTLILSIVVFTLFPTDVIVESLGFEDGLARFGVVLLSRLLLFPVVAGLSYEVTVRWAGRHPEHPLVRIVLAPGMAMQLITTNDPDDSMLECAIAAMKIVVAREAAEEGRELGEDGLPADLSALEGCPLETAVPQTTPILRT